MAVAIIGAPPKPKAAARVMTMCVEERHLPEFQDQMNAFLTWIESHKSNSPTTVEGIAPSPDKPAPCCASARRRPQPPAPASRAARPLQAENQPVPETSPEQEGKMMPPRPLVRLAPPLAGAGNAVLPRGIRGLCTKDPPSKPPPKPLSPSELNAVSAGHVPAAGRLLSAALLLPESRLRRSCARRCGTRCCRTPGSIRRGRWTRRCRSRKPGRWLSWSTSFLRSGSLEPLRTKKNAFCFSAFDAEVQISVEMAIQDLQHRNSSDPNLPYLLTEEGRDD
ncbi:hypothetical protein EJB05_17852, partial [Eragrostis curvula]